MISALALLLQVAAAVPPAVVVRAGSHQTKVPVVMVHGVPTVAAGKLIGALGGAVKPTGGGHYTVTLGESRLRLTEGDPFARVDSTLVPLTSSPVTMDGTLYVPFQIVAEVLPRFMTNFLYDAEARELRSFTTPGRSRTSSSAPPPTPAASVPVASTPSAPEDSGNEGTSLSRSHRRRRKHVVIVDAWHGGVDNGMTGPIGGGPKIYEKYVTLSVAKLVAQDLRDAGVDVIMTRTTDTLIALVDRGRIANRSHGDAFVSIHVNATGSRGKDAARERGFETYFLAEAKTEDAKRVEKMENEAVRFETGASAPKGNPLNYILHDMAQNEHLRESNELAQLVQDSFRSFHPGPDRGVQQANFAVLRGSYMPAVLVEIGFGTNKDEAAFISDPDNQHAIARSITKSVLKYLERYDARVGGREGR